MQQPRVLVVQTFYPEFLNELYAAEPDLARWDFAGQMSRLFGTFFGVGDAYSSALRALGCDATEVICNADAAQRAWAKEHGFATTGNIHDQRRQIVAAQVAHDRPDVLLVFEWCPLGDLFLAELKPHVRLLAGQIASPLPLGRTFAAYDLMLSSYPPIVDHFRRMGTTAEYLKLAFDPRVLQHIPTPTRAAGFSPRDFAGGTKARTLDAARKGQVHEGTEGDTSIKPKIETSKSERGAEARSFDATRKRQVHQGAEPLHGPVTFVGGFAANHQERIAWLESVVRCVDVDVFGYGLERCGDDSPIRRHHRGPAWGLRMYEILAQSRLTLNYHAAIDVRGQVDTRYANNMRLYEATGVGTCLLTEAKENLSEMFEPDREVVTFRDAEECVEKIRYLLAHETERAAIAQAGQRRTLQDHTYSIRMAELLDILSSRITR